MSELYLVSCTVDFSHNCRTLFVCLQHLSLNVTATYRMQTLNEISYNFDQPAYSQVSSVTKESQSMNIY